MLEMPGDRERERQANIVTVVCTGLFLLLVVGGLVVAQCGGPERTGAVAGKEGAR